MDWDNNEPTTEAPAPTEEPSPVSVDLRLETLELQVATLAKEIDALAFRIKQHLG